MKIKYIDHETLRLDGTDYPFPVAEAIIKSVGLPVDHVIEEAYTESLTKEHV